MEVVLQVLFGGAILGFVVYCVAATLAGMKPSSTKLASYESETKGQSRFYREPVNVVVQAYGDAATKAAGMNVADIAPDTLLIDASPTPRILGGSFGMLVRYRFTPTTSGTAVAIDGSKKVSWAVAIRPDVALTEIERTVRMNSKSKAGLNELGSHEISADDVPSAARRFDA